MLKGQLKNKGENMVGGKITAPVVKAKSATKAEYKDAFSPTKKAIDVNQKVSQNGYDITVNKIEIADEETRVYVTANGVLVFKNVADSGSLQIVLEGPSDN
ncbi:TPA: hypothetical protein ROX88_003905 [Bacillus pseudomycoides]|nr:hypothetical protein [Bacillus pseudomycoides]